MPSDRSSPAPSPVALASGPAPWNEAAPAPLPPLTRGERLRGGARLAALALATTLALGAFLLGHNLRRALGKRVGFHFRVATLWSRAGLWIMGLERRVEGHPVTRGALVANHTGWLDIFAVRAVRLVYFVSKAEVARWPGVGFITRVTGTVFIERRRVEAKRQEEVLLERIAANQVLCFFPEGTSTDGAQVLAFKSSLFSAFFRRPPALDGDAPVQVPVQPVSIRYHPGPGLPETFYGWWGTMGFEAHLWQVLCRSRRGRVSVIFHDPVVPGAFPDRKAMADHCRRAVATGHARAASAA